jgi:VanZ family protein
MSIVPRMIVWWFAALAWAAEIFYLSTPTFRGSFSQSLLIQLLDSLHLSVSPDILDVLDSMLRKFAHLTEYAIFGLLLYGSFGRKDGFRWRPRLASWCLVVASAYSLSDELHQVFSSGRHASLIDCAIDTTGSAVAMAMVYGCSRLSTAMNSKGFAP